MLPGLSLKENLKTPVEFKLQDPDGGIRELTPARYSPCMHSDNVPTHIWALNKYNLNTNKNNGSASHLQLGTGCV